MVLLCAQTHNFLHISFAFNLLLPPIYVPITLIVFEDGFGSSDLFILTLGAKMAECQGNVGIKQLYNQKQYTGESTDMVSFNQNSCLCNIWMSCFARPFFMNLTSH